MPRSILVLKVIYYVTKVNLGQKLVLGMKIPLLYTVTIFRSLFYAELEHGSLLQIVDNLVEGNCNSRRGTKVTCANCVMRWFDVFSNQRVRDLMEEFDMHTLQIPTSGCGHPT